MTFAKDSSVLIWVNQHSCEVSSGPSPGQHQTHLDSIFMLLEKQLKTYVGKELKKIKTALNSDNQKQTEDQSEDKKVLDDEEAEQKKICKEALLKMTVVFLKRMDQEELADCLQNSKRVSEKIQHATHTGV
ncbi:uncharacterized protein LOC127374624 isoform X2 [Xyrichtys novacula]|uniref:Uncharacterized protein LOC127374624 isoform X2 n=1 Tax=Xyrichtys novacula TaxID=13765 RepID=A0AAV1HQU4_XYRNO|nr:uncharacterized protein LOC127374624 isoform X2 [Xyrichtys novacula]